MSITIYSNKKKIKILFIRLFFNNIPIKILPVNTSSYLYSQTKNITLANKILIKEVSLTFVRQY